jgi:hypothetical protein
MTWANQPTDTSSPQTRLLKKQILKISSQNTSQEQGREQTRHELDQLIRELALAAGPVTESRALDFSPGSWQLLWTDKEDLTPLLPPLNYGNIYQYSSIQGWGLSFEERQDSQGQVIAFVHFLAGKLQNLTQNFEVIDVMVRLDGLPRGESLGELAHKVKTGADSGFEEIDAIQFPLGPVGIKSQLSIEFIDSDLRIGYAAHPVTGKKELLVYKRVQTIEE